MLFNSTTFIYWFFPIVLTGFFLLGAHRRDWAAMWLAFASLVFYGWWSIKAVPLLLISVCFNYFAGLAVSPAAFGYTDARRRALLVGAIAIDLGVLGFFKYADFFITNANVLLTGLGTGTLPLLKVVLPIGISFYTFTQIAFLVDCWQGKVRERNFVHYMLFVTYFPHLIAGPVLHHSQMMPQFAKPGIYRPSVDKLALGLAIFILGLSKKLLLADPLGSYADVAFASVHGGQLPSLATSWLGVLAYTFQIYFDFSGYSDMAIGLSWCFGIKLPINFNSPYKATSIIEFWRRWHITLSVFLRDYLYIPLGGNRKGPTRRHVNLLTTMVLGGLWHGASWTFVLWGAAHGVLLTLNHLWREHGPVRRVVETDTGATRLGLGRCIAWLATFVSVCFTWVLFRAENLSDARLVYLGMIGLGSPLEAAQAYAAPALAAVLAIALLLPNTQQLMGYSETPSAADDARVVTFRPLTVAALALLLFACGLLINQPSPFLYFQF